MSDVLRISTREQLLRGLEMMMVDLTTFNNGGHLKDTPHRVVRAWEELFSGLRQNPQTVLGTTFSEEHYDEMICIKNIEFNSTCAHHLLGFSGHVHFGYLPNKSVVGLSKVPRMVDILARRPQIQEQLTQQIVQNFQEAVQPLGCAAMVEATHECVRCRGVRKQNSVMVTTALAGYFKDRPEVKSEFLWTVRGRR